MVVGSGDWGIPTSANQGYPSRFSSFTVFPAYRQPQAQGPGYLAAHVLGTNDTGTLVNH